MRKTFRQANQHDLYTPSKKKDGEKELMCIEVVRCLSYDLQS